MGDELCRRRSGSVETVGGNSEGTGTTETSTSQTPSCRALAGKIPPCRALAGRYPDSLM
jgi:hypothetical protein